MLGCENLQHPGDELIRSRAEPFQEAKSRPRTSVIALLISAFLVSSTTPVGAQEAAASFDGYSDTGVEVTIPKGSFRGLTDKDRFPEGVEEAWYRYYIQLTNFQPKSSGKLPGLSGLYSHTARGCFPSGPNSPGWSARGLFGAAGSNGAPEGEIPIGSYIYHLNQPGRCGEAIYWDDTSIRPDRWYCVEGYVKVNTPGSADGVVTGWLDGTERFSRSNFVFRRPSETHVGVRELWLDIYYGGRRPTRETLNLRIDEVEVSTSGRVGCIESKTTVVATSGSGLASIASYDPGTGDWSLAHFDGSSFVSKSLTRYQSATQWGSHLVGDFGGDGRDDIASYHPANGTWWVSRSGEFGFKTARWATFSTKDGWNAHLTGDFSGSGRSEIASFNISNGTWWVSTPRSSLDRPEHAANELQFSWFQQPGSEWRDITASQVRHEALAPIQGNANYFDTSLWGDFDTATGWTTQLAGDYDGDGKDDIASYHAESGNWWVSLSSGTGFATTQWDRFSTGRGWSNHLAGDFNGDGRDDIASYHPGSGQWWVSLSTGSGFTTVPWERFNTTTGWSTHVAGDFNGDGSDDIASYYPGSGAWWVSLSTGTGFSTQHWGSFSTTRGWTTQVAGDFDGDGDDDIANFHPASGTWWVNRSTGNGFDIVRWAG